MTLFEETNYDGASFPDPRDFQAAAHERLRDGLRSGHRCQMLMAPTGAGKTYLGLRICHEALAKGRRALFVCDRTTLINQTSETADSYGLSAHGVVQAQHWRYAPDKPFQIASVQTLARRDWPEAHVIVIDEAHTQHKAWVDHIQATKAAVIGLSATPFSVGLGRLFTNLVNAATMADLVDAGVLVPMRVFSCRRINMEGAATAGANGEWTDEAAAKRGMEIIGDVVAEWQKLASDRKTIVFGATIKHCEEMCAAFNAAGVMSALFTSDTLPEERTEILKEYKKPDSLYRVLISVEALAKGFDVKDVGAVVDCRPLRKSLSTAIQMWGRGLRASPETKKRDCLLLDHSGNIQRFADDFEAIYHQGLDALDAGEKLDKSTRLDDEEKEAAKCPSCGYQPFAKRCMSCGFERVSPAMLEAAPGEMVEVMIGKKKMADDRRHAWEQVCSYVRGHSKTAKPQGYAVALFKEITGSLPPMGWDLARTPDVPISKNVWNHIRARNIAFYKAKQKQAVEA